MLRHLYVWLLQLHPAAFRQRFGDEMLEIFDNARNLRSTLLTTADGFISLIRQRAFRREFHHPSPAVAASEGFPDVPLFRPMDPYKPRPIVLLQGGLLTVVILFALTGMLGNGSKARAFLIGAHRPSHLLLPVVRASGKENSTIPATLPVSRSGAEPSVIRDLN